MAHQQKKNFDANALAINLQIFEKENGKTVLWINNNVIFLAFHSNSC